MATDLIIRPYRASDRTAIETICAETGLRGKLHRYFCDTELFTRIWLAPYLVKENPHNLVVEMNGEVVGYLIASVGPRFRLRVLRRCVPLLCILVWRLLCGRYRHHEESAQFVRWLLTACWREYPHVPAGMESHFHFNLRDDVRGRRTGPKLIQMFHEKMRESGLNGWHGVVFMSGERSTQMWERLGMTIGESRRCSLFQDEEVLFTCLYRKVEPPTAIPTATATDG